MRIFVIIAIVVLVLICNISSFGIWEYFLKIKGKIDISWWVTAEAMLQARVVVSTWGWIAASTFRESSFRYGDLVLRASSIHTLLHGTRLDHFDTIFQIESYLLDNRRPAAVAVYSCAKSLVAFSNLLLQCNIGVVLTSDGTTKRLSLPFGTGLAAFLVTTKSQVTPGRALLLFLTISPRALLELRSRIAAQRSCSASAYSTSRRG